MNIRIAILVLFLLPALFSFGQTVERVNQKIERFQKRFPQEKLFVQTDKPYYALGETIWFKAWLTEARRLMPSTTRIWTTSITWWKTISSKQQQ